MTNAELAVLSLVIEAPRHGYEIEQVIEERGMRDWTDVGFSSIYYLLDKMRKRGWVAVREEPGERGPGRKVFGATPEGCAACGAATLEALSVPPQGTSPFLLGLSNLPAVPLEDAREALASYRDTLSERLEGLAGKRSAAAVGGGEWFVDALFDYSEVMIAAERDWVARLVEDLGRRVKGEAAKMPGLRAGKPEIVELPARTMAVVHTTGEPQEEAQQAFPALYGAVYPLKFALKKQGVEYKIEAPRARWLGGPDWTEIPREEWRADWAIPVPEGIVELQQKVPDVPVAVEKWEYGTVAQVLYVGAYSDEEPTIRALHAFIEEQGYEIVGPHEEEYRSTPQAKNPKTVIRYQVRKKRA